MAKHRKRLPITRRLRIRPRRLHGDDEEEEMLDIVLALTDAACDLSKDVGK